MYRSSDASGGAGSNANGGTEILRCSQERARVDRLSCRPPLDGGVASWPQTTRSSCAFFASAIALRRSAKLVFLDLLISIFYAQENGPWPKRLMVSDRRLPRHIPWLNGSEWPGASLPNAHSGTGTRCRNPIGRQ